MALRYPEIFNREARILAADQDLSVSLPLDFGRIASPSVVAPATAENQASERLV
jgi:hypothetical protein